MKALLLLLPLAACIARADELAHADLAKLGDPEKALAEVTRLVIGPDREDYTLMGYRFLKAAQADGKPPLHILCGERKYTSRFRSSGEYEIDDAAEIFGDEHRNVFARLQPSLDYIKDSVLFVFDDKGNEIRPFGGDNYIDGGHICDFDGDGILDRAGSTNYGLDEAPKHSVEMFELESVETKPRQLLRVIFNWHPDSADDANEWTYRCTDLDGDGRPEIRFGPKDPGDGENAEPFVFKWDQATGKFSAGEIPKGSHILVLGKDDSLKSVAKAGGLGYPLIGKTDDGDTPAAVKSPQAPFTYTTFAGMPEKQLAAFFKGKDRRDFSDGAEGSFPDVVPENLFSMPPKQAALALADANRTPGHRRKFQLAIDDRKGIAPPASGWVQHSWSSSGCYSFSSTLTAIRFGEPDPLLLSFGYNSIGVVGRNPWADQPANRLRIVRLSEKEAAFLAETLFWLDRVRSRSLIQDDDHRMSGFSSTADGFSSITLLPTGEKPQELASETDWATSSISGRWDGDYNREVFANLASLLIRTGVPNMLGKRWESDNDTGHQSLMTPTEERLRDRIGAEAREKLAADLASVIAMDAKGTVPPDVITRIAFTAGDEALVPLLPALGKMLASLPAESDEEKECKALEKRFARDHFGDPLGDEPQEHKDAYKRLTDLREKLRFFRPAILREPLETAVEKLRLASDSSRLKEAFLQKSPHAQWALALLRRTEPETWAILVAADFEGAGIKERQTIFSTLAAGHPPAAAAMIPNFSKAERRDLIIEISDFHKAHSPDEFPADIPILMDLVRDRKQDLYRRIDAMETLAAAELSEAQSEDLTKLLLDEIRSPQKGEYFSGTLGAALDALAALPHPEAHLELVLSLPHIPRDAFDNGFHAVDAMTRNHPDRTKILAEFLKTQFVASSGMMNDHFIKALAYDLQILAPEIAAFASESPNTEDGDGANYSGGNFKTPVGQRYHIAREITALWSERDEGTLGRMWVAFVAAHPGEFQERKEPSVIRQLAAKHIRTLPAAERKEAIAAIQKEIPIPDYYADSLKWLNSLND